MLRYKKAVKHARQRLFGPALVLSLVHCVGDSGSAVVQGSSFFQGNSELHDALGTSIPSCDGVCRLKPGAFLFHETTSEGLGAQPFSIARADFNRDGLIDIAVANLRDNTVSILTNNAMGRFTPASTEDVGRHPRVVVSADFNRDGIADLATVNGYEQSVTILIGELTGGFAAKSVSLASRCSSLTTGDYNGDGHVDLAATGYNADQVSVLFGDGESSFEERVVPSPGRWNTVVASGDMNQDGALDLIVGNRYGDQRLHVLFNNGQGHFQPAPDVGARIGYFPTSIRVEDLNLDGRLDLAVTALYDDHVAILYGSENGGFAVGPVLPSTRPFGILSQDFDRNGTPDLAIISSSGRKLSVFSGIGDGLFGIPRDFALEQAPTAFTSADFNADGLMDVVIASSSGGNLTIAQGAIPSDEHLERLWGLRKIEAIEAWSKTEGEYVDDNGMPQRVVVAVVDTGVDYTHPDLEENIWLNPGELPNVLDANLDGALTLEDLVKHGLEDANRDGRISLDDVFVSALFLDGLDNDSNGYPDDIMGWNTIANTPDPIDQNGHGTHIAGTIAAVGHNTIGVIGIAPRALIMPVKGITEKAIRYAAENGANVISASIASLGRAPIHTRLQQAIESATDDYGVTVVIAAGNQRDDAAYYNPGNLENVITVAASTVEDSLASFSNHGVGVDIRAPGVGIYSTFPDGRYRYLSGTSMATPHVSGVCALVLSLHPTLTPREVAQIIRASSDEVEETTEGNLHDAQREWITDPGRVNALRALDDHSPLNSLIQEVQFQEEGVAIYGHANGEEFFEYELMVRAGEDSSGWMNITNRGVVNPVSADLLGIWAQDNLPYDNYYIRLLVRSSTGWRLTNTVQAQRERPVFEISTEAVKETVPRIFADTVVWQQQNKILKRSLAAASENVIEIAPTTDWRRNPDVSDQFVVWEEEQSRVWNIMSLPREAGAGEEPTKIAPWPSKQENPATDGPYIVWEDDRGGDKDIYLYDATKPSSEAVSVITDAPGDQVNPNIVANRDSFWIVWEDRSGSQPRIYLFSHTPSGSNMFRIESEVPGRNPSIALDGESDYRVVWQGYGTSDGNDSTLKTWDIYMLDSKSGTIQQVTTSLHDEIHPRLLGKRLVWTSDRHVDTNIHFLDLGRINDGEIRVTTNPYDQSAPALSSEVIVWQDYRDKRLSIYGAYIDSLSLRQAVTSSSRESVLP